MRKQEQIQTILNEFDFVKIHSAMTHLKWLWTYDNGEGNPPVKKIPALEDLKDIAEHCLNQVANSQDNSATFYAGGFEAEKIENILELRFILDRVNPLSQLLNTDAADELARKA